MSGRKRTNQQSQLFKAEIAALKKRGKSLAEIARELGVSKQYVSQVLVQAGLADGRRHNKREKPDDATVQVIATVDRLEQQEHLGLAEKLREILDRNAKAKNETG